MGPNMLKKTIFAFLTALILLLSSCIAAVDTGAGPGEASSNFMKVEHSNAFSLEYLEDGAKLPTDADDQKFLLVPRGEAAPEGYEDAILLYTPVERAVSFSTTQVGMISHYDGILDYFAGVSADAGTWGASKTSKNIWHREKLNT